MQSVPAEVFPFRNHPRRQVRSIRLRDLYWSVLRGLDYMIDLLHVHENLDIDDFLTFFVGLQTSAQPFLYRNRSVRSIVARLAGLIADRVDRELDPDFDNLRVLCDLTWASAELPAAVRRSVQRTLRRGHRCLRKGDPAFYAPPGNPVVERLRRRCRRRRVGTAVWDQWLLKILDVAYASILGIRIDADAFYRTTVAEILQVPFQERHINELFNVITHTSFAMSCFHRRPMFRNRSMNELADHGMSFYAWLDEHDLHDDDVEMLAEFVDAFMKGPSRCYDADPRYGSIVQLILDSQSDDGGWSGSDQIGLTAHDPDDFYDVYHRAWVCIDALRPVRSDLANPGNRLLGLC